MARKGGDTKGNCDGEESVTKVKQIRRIEEK